MQKFFHPFHMVSFSPWPVITGIGVVTFVIGMINMFIYMEVLLIFLSFIVLLLTASVWWRDVIRESTFQGGHSSNVLGGLMLGMILFIVSEIFFFLSFFWAFFHSSLSPVIYLGGIWPPCGIESLNAFQVPLLNTVILLASGVSVTWAHQTLLGENFLATRVSLMVTWGLGIYFLFLQWMEYSMSMFSISDSVYGSTFFMATGFHGFHVMVGTLFLMIMWQRVGFVHFSSSHHLGFEFAAWYWHFVDVVWLFLFSVVYWWGTFL